MTVQDEILRVEGLQKSYGKVRALQNVSISLRSGDIHAIVGDNGAGKSTLLGILSGYETPDAGQIKLAGEVVNFSNVADAMNRGIAMTYEEYALVDSASVWENFHLGREVSRVEKPINVLDIPTMHSSTSDALRRYGFEFSADKLASELSGGQRRILVVSRAIEAAPDVLLLDEPFRGLSERAIAQLWSILDEFTKAGSIIMTSQWYKPVAGKATNLTFLRNGKIVGKAHDDEIDEKTANKLVMRGRA
jgi:ABC-type sugar transport system ATPase subunit